MVKNTIFLDRDERFESLPGRVNSTVINQRETYESVLSSGHI